MENIKTAWNITEQMNYFQFIQVCPVIILMNIALIL